MAISYQKKIIEKGAKIQGLRVFGFVDSSGSLNALKLVDFSFLKNRKFWPKNLLGDFVLSSKISKICRLRLK